MTYSLSAIFFGLTGSSKDRLERVRQHLRSCGLEALHIVQVEAGTDARFQAEEHLVRLRQGMEWTHIAFCLDQTPRPVGMLEFDLDDARVLRVADVDTGEGTAGSALRSTEVSATVVGWTRGTREAWAVGRIVCPEHYAEMRGAVLEAVDAVLPPFPVVKDLSSLGVHAKVYLVRHEGRLAVCKIFRSGRHGELAREKKGLSLAGRVRGVPRLIMARDNWVLMEYLEGYEELKPGFLGFLPVALVRKAFGYLRELHEAGYFLLDFHTRNVIARDTEAKIVDLEHLYEYPTQAPQFEQSPSFVGAAYFATPSVAEILEKSGSRLGRGTWYPTYEKTWKPVLGVELDTLLHGGWARIMWEQLKYIALVKAPRRIRRTALRRRHV